MSYTRASLILDNDDRILSYTDGSIMITTDAWDVHIPKEIVDKIYEISQEANDV